MQSGGTRQTVLVAAAIAAVAVLAAWWGSTREPAVPAMRPKLARAQAANDAAVEAARMPVAPALAHAKSEPVADTPAVIPFETRPAPPRGDAGDTSPKSTTAEEAPADEAESAAPAADDAPADEPASDPAADAATATAESDAEKPEGEAAQTAEAAAADVVDAAAPGSAVDADHAADLFARLLDKVESGNNPADASQKQEFHDFENLDAGGDGERAIEQALRERLGAWIVTLPPALAQHVLLASVDCHVGQCRVLLAQSGVDFAGRSPRDPDDPLNVMQAATWSFLGEGLPPQVQWRVISNGWTAAGDDRLDTALWVIMLGDTAA